MRKILLFALILQMHFSTILHAQLRSSFKTSFDSVCENVADSFFASATGGTPPYSFNWNFGGDIHRLAPSNTGEIFTNAGLQLVTLKVQDSKGNIDSASRLIRVLP